MQATSENQSMTAQPSEHQVMQFHEAQLKKMIASIEFVANNPGSKDLSVQNICISSPYFHFVELLKTSPQICPVAIKQFACSLLKMKVSKQATDGSQIDSQQPLPPNKSSQDYSLFSAKWRYLLRELQQIYMTENPLGDSNISKVQSSIEFVFESIFESMGDDSQKIRLFEAFCEHLTNESLFEQERHLKIMSLLVGKMHFLTLNSEVVIGELTVYLSDSVDRCNSQQISTKQKPEVKEAYFSLLIEVIDLMSNIMEIVEESQEESQQFLMEFLRKSSTFEKAIHSILCLQFSTEYSSIPKSAISIISSENNRLNSLKSKALDIWLSIHTYFAEENILQLAFNTVLSTPKSLITDEMEGIISNCLVILERSSCRKQYCQAFFKAMQNLTIKILELVAITEAEFSLIESDYEYFLEIMDDFCKIQELQTLKVRAGSLLSNLAMSVDGYLTFVTQLAVLALERLSNASNAAFLAQTQESWENLLKIWPCSEEQLIETSILVLSQLSDQIVRRPDLHQSVMTPLKTLHAILSVKGTSSSQQMIDYLRQKTVIELRLIQIFAFYCFPGCLNPFLENCSPSEIHKKQIRMSYETMLHYYDRKNEGLEKYVKEIGNMILVLSDELNSLLEQQIMTGSALIQNRKEHFLEKLVIWFIDAYRDIDHNNVLTINKLSTLIVKLIRDSSNEQPPTKLTKLNQKNTHLTGLSLQSQESQTLSKAFDLQYLKETLSPTYKLLLGHANHPCEQGAIEILSTHIEYLNQIEFLRLKSYIINSEGKGQMNIENGSQNFSLNSEEFVSLQRILNDSARHVQLENSGFSQQRISFYQAGRRVVRRNKCTINSCTGLFCALIAPRQLIRLFRALRQSSIKNWASLSVFEQSLYSLSKQLLLELEAWILEQPNTDKEPEEQQEDTWELLHITEICIYQLFYYQQQSGNHNLNSQTSQSVEKLLLCFDKIYSKAENCALVKKKLLFQMLLLSKKEEHLPLTQKSTVLNECLNFMSQPSSVVAYEARQYCYLLMSLFKKLLFEPSWETNTQRNLQILSVIIEFVYFLEFEKEQLKKYEQQLFVKCSSIEINSSRLHSKSKEYHPFEIYTQFSLYEDFRKLIEFYPRKQELRLLDAHQRYQGKINDLIGKIMVNDRPRKRIIVRGPK